MLPVRRLAASAPERRLRSAQHRRAPRRTGDAEARVRQDDAAPVPQRLLAAATRLFAERGYEKTSVQEIVAAAGVTKGAMYHYFAAKEDLLQEVYARVLRMQSERLETFVLSTRPLTVRLHDAACDVVVTAIENLDDTRIFFQSMHRLPEERQRAVRAERRRYHERFRSMVQQGQSDGTFRTDVPADLVVDYFFGSVHHLATWFRAGGALSARQIGDHFADLLLGSLRPA